MADRGVDPVAQDVIDKWTRGVKATRTPREIAAVNTAFLDNQQWVSWNREEGRLQELRRDPARMRVTINRIAPTTDVLFSKLLNRPLVFHVPPTAPDDARIRAARIGVSALTQAAADLGWEGVRELHASLAWEHGVGGLMIEWDKRYGTPVGDDGTATGEICVKAVSLHEMAFEPGTRDGERAYWWVHGVALPPADVQEQYGLGEEPPADARAIDNVWRYTDGEHQAATPLTMVYRCWERPCRGREGAVTTVVGGRVVEREKWPFPWTDYLNICLASPRRRHGKWWGTTPLTSAIGPQALYNAAHTSIGEHMKRAANVRLGVPEGSLDDEEELTDEPGEILRYNPINGLKPDWLNIPTMADWWARYPAMIEAIMDDTLHVHEVSRGDAPAGVESGRALAVLLEADDSPIGDFARRLGQCWGRVASLALKLWEARVTETRTATIRSEAGLPQAEHWKGKDLMGQTTAIVPDEAVTPRSRAAQIGWAMDLMDRGAIQSVHDLAKVANLPDRDDLLAALDPDTIRAQRENYWMAQGVPRTVAVYDDDANHLHVLRNFMRTEIFEQLPLEAEPGEPSQTNFYLHAEAHELQAAEKAAAQAQAGSVSPIAALMPTLTTKPIPADDLEQAAVMSEAAVGAVAGGGAGAGGGGELPASAPGVPPGVPPGLAPPDGAVPLPPSPEQGAMNV